ATGSTGAGSRAMPAMPRTNAPMRWPGPGWRPGRRPPRRDARRAAADAGLRLGRRLRGDGALAASRSQLDIVGFIFIACRTATGGGTTRAVILPVATAAAVSVFLAAHLLESRYRALLWIDAFALAVAVPAGVAAATGTGQAWPIVLVMGTI